MRVITKSADRKTRVKFVNQEYAYRTNWTPESPVTNKSLPLKFPKMTNTFVGDNISVRALSQVRVPPFWKFSVFVVVVAMVIVINSGIGGFSSVDQV